MDVLKSPIVVGCAILAFAGIVITLVLTGHWGDISSAVTTIFAGLAAIIGGMALKGQGRTTSALSSVAEKVTTVADSTAKRDLERVGEKTAMNQTIHELKTSAAQVASAAATVAAATNTNIPAMTDDTGK